jgi:dolichol-phosphate mannosyltransferase
MKGLVIIPTYNECENIEPLVSKILATDSRLEILVVDDNSPDDTGKIAEELSEQQQRVHVMHREKKMGLGSAYIAGFKYGLTKDYDVFFEMDADFSHDPKYLPDFMKTIKDHDVVIGSRYLRGVNVVNWPMHRLLLSYCANIYVRSVTGLPVRDATGGYKCFRRRVLESLDLDGFTAEGYGFQIEMNFKCWRRGFSLQEIPIVFVERSQGKTKMSRAIIIEAIWIVWKLKLMALTGKR